MSPRIHRFIAHSHIERKHTFSQEVSPSLETLFYYGPTYPGSTLLRLLSLPQLETYTHTHTNIHTHTQTYTHTHTHTHTHRAQTLSGRLTFRKSFTSIYLKKKSVKIHCHKTTAPALVKILSRQSSGVTSVGRNPFCERKGARHISRLLPRTNLRPRDSPLTDRR